MVEPTKKQHPSVEERRARGKQLKCTTPRSSHLKWKPAADRPDPVALLEEQDATREPDLVPVRHGRMMVSPFTFYRGAAKIMAADLKDTPRAGLTVQLCGDAHLSNFGVFASPERDARSSTSTTSTRRCPARSSTTSSAWPRASPSRRATTGSARPTRARRRSRRSTRLPRRRWPSSPTMRTHGHLVRPPAPSRTLMAAVKTRGAP